MAMGIVMRSPAEPFALHHSGKRNVIWNRGCHSDASGWLPPN
jgi:hypothetical protein